MSDYFETMIRPHARLAILRFLEGAPQYTSNVSMMGTLVQSVGISMTRVQLQAEVDWLVEQELATTQAPTPTLSLVTATLAGVEVATGVGSHDGVQRPRPGA